MRRLSSEISVMHNWIYWKCGLDRLLPWWMKVGITLALSLPVALMVIMLSLYPEDEGGKQKKLT